MTFNSFNSFHVVATRKINKQKNKLLRPKDDKNLITGIGMEIVLIFSCELHFNKDKFNSRIRYITDQQLNHSHHSQFGKQQKKERGRSNDNLSEGWKDKRSSKKMIFNLS